jgi:hypothetical protein
MVAGRRCRAVRTEMSSLKECCAEATLLILQYQSRNLPHRHGITSRNYYQSTLCDLPLSCVYCSSRLAPHARSTHPDSPEIFFRPKTCIEARRSPHGTHLKDFPQQPNRSRTADRMEPASSHPSITKNVPTIPHTQPEHLTSTCPILILTTCKLSDHEPIHLMLARTFHLMLIPHLEHTNKKVEPKGQEQKQSKKQNSKQPRSEPHILSTADHRRAPRCI